MRPRRDDVRRIERVARPGLRVVEQLRVRERPVRRRRAARARARRRGKKRLKRAEAKRRAPRRRAARSTASSASRAECAAGKRQAAAVSRAPRGAAPPRWRRAASTAARCSRAGRRRPPTARSPTPVAGDRPDEQRPERPEARPRARRPSGGRSRCGRGMRPRRPSARRSTSCNTNATSQASACVSTPAARNGSSAIAQTSGQPNTAAPLGFIQCTSTQTSRPEGGQRRRGSHGREVGPPPPERRRARPRGEPARIEEAEQRAWHARPARHELARRGVEAGGVARRPPRRGSRWNAGFPAVSTRRRRTRREGSRRGTAARSPRGPHQRTGRP